MSILTGGLGGPLLLTRGLGTFTAAAAAAADLVDAIDALVQQQLVATGVLTWFGADKAPPGQALPYAEIEDFDEVPDDWMNDDPEGIASFDDFADIPINIYASTKSAAKALGRQLASLLTDASLVFQDGDLLYLRRGPISTAALDPDPAPGGGDCWSVSVILHAITAKTI